MKKKLNSYQKQKERIAELTEQVRILIEKPESEKANMIRFVHHAVKNDIEKSLWAGIRTEDHPAMDAMRSSHINGNTINQDGIYSFLVENSNRPSPIDELIKPQRDINHLMMNAEHSINHMKGIVSIMKENAITDEVLKEKQEFLKTHVVLAKGKFYKSKDGTIKQGTIGNFGGQSVWFAPKDDI